ncbi:MAG: hypothetical protein ACTSRZ_08305 [Promethearchaeota archaeon]
MAQNLVNYIEEISFESPPINEISTKRYVINVKEFPINIIINPEILKDYGTIEEICVYTFYKQQNNNNQGNESSIKYQLIEDCKNNLNINTDYTININICEFASYRINLLFKNLNNKDQNQQSSRRNVNTPESETFNLNPNLFDDNDFVKNFQKFLELPIYIYLNFNKTKQHFLIIPLFNSLGFLFDLIPNNARLLNDIFEIIFRVKNKYKNEFAIIKDNLLDNIENIFELRGFGTYFLKKEKESNKKGLLDFFEIDIKFNDKKIENNILLFPEKLNLNNNIILNILNTSKFPYKFPFLKEILKNIFNHNSFKIYFPENMDYFNLNSSLKAKIILLENFVLETTTNTNTRVNENTYNNLEEVISDDLLNNNFYIEKIKELNNNLSNILVVIIHPLIKITSNEGSYRTKLKLFFKKKSYFEYLLKFVDDEFLEKFK